MVRLNIKNPEENVPRGKRRSEMSGRFTFTDYFEQYFPELFDEYPKLEKLVSLRTINNIFIRRLIIANTMKNETPKSIKKKLKMVNSGKPIKTVERLVFKYDYVEKVEFVESDERVYHDQGRQLGAGEMVEIDAHFAIYGQENKMSALHMAYERGERKLKAIYLARQETVQGYMHLFNDMANGDGFGMIMKSDRRIGLASTKGGPTPLVQQLIDSGVDYQFSSDPLFKAGVERANRTVKDSINVFMHKNDIKTMEQFNQKRFDFIEYFNSRYSVTASKKGNFWIKLNSPLNEVFYKINRKVNAGFVRYENKNYAPYDENGRRVSLKNKVVATFVQDQDKKHWFLISGKKYEALPPNKNALSSYELFALRKGLDPSNNQAKVLYEMTRKASSIVSMLTEKQNILYRTNDKEIIQSLVDQLHKIEQQNYIMIRIIEESIKF